MYHIYSICIRANIIFLACQKSVPVLSYILLYPGTGTTVVTFGYIVENPVCRSWVCWLGQHKVQYLHTIHSPRADGRWSGPRHAPSHPGGHWSQDFSRLGKLLHGKIHLAEVRIWLPRILRLWATLWDVVLLASVKGLLAAVCNMVHVHQGPPAVHHKVLHVRPQIHSPYERPPHQWPGRRFSPAVRCQRGREGPLRCPAAASHTANCHFRTVKGTRTQDFCLPVFFMNQLPPRPWLLSYSDF